MFELLGRFHVVVVHFPIALLIVGALLELSNARSHDAGRAAAGRVCIALGAAGAVAAAVLGWIHADCIGSGSSQARTLGLHRWLGIATALFACAAVVFGVGAPTSSTARKMRVASVALAAVLVGITGHLGGTLVFGEGFFASAFDEDEQPPPSSAAVPRDSPSTEPASVGAGVDFATQIRPLFEARCYECHGPRKKKGKLRLDRLARVFDEDEFGFVIKRGDPAASRLFERVTLPADHDDHMPPADEGPPLAPEQIELLRAWISAGAPIPDGLAEAPAPEESAEPESDGEPDAEPESEPAHDALEAALAELRATGAIAQRVALDSDDLEVDFHLLGAAVGDEQLAPLAALAPVLVQLNLARTAITDAGLANVALLTRLEKLDLSSTATTDAALAQLAALTRLEVLNLHGTRITDRGLLQVGALASLKRVYVWQSQVTAEGAAALATLRPDLSVVRGD